MNGRARRRWQVTGWGIAVVVAAVVFWATQSVLPSVLVGSLVALAAD